MIQKPRAAIVGCQGLTLSQDEKDLYKQTQPLGFILFARNIESSEQVKKLCDDLRETVGREETPILIDQEGGKVARFQGEDWPESPAFELFGELYESNPDQAIEAVEINTLLQSSYLRKMGITVNCSPVLDLRFPGAHDIIGSRAFSSDPDVVSVLGKVACHAFLRGGITPVIKHIPGHGRALADSHLELPVVDINLTDLEKTDFYPFQQIYHDPLLKEAAWGMVAHILYPSCDPGKPATTSTKVVETICREILGGTGFLVADDIGMEALTGDLPTRARATVCSGLDGTLACNHTTEELKVILEATPEMTDQAYDRFITAEKHRTDFEKKNDSLIPSTKELAQSLEDVLSGSVTQLSQVSL